MDFHKKWIEQCAASINIKERYGIEKALGYLIGEKLFLHLEMAEKDELWENEVIPFCNEIKNLFEQYEIKRYLDERKNSIENVNLDDSEQRISRLEKIRTLLIES